MLKRHFDAIFTFKNAILTVFISGLHFDYMIMKLCGYSACPADSHIEIKKLASKVLISNGGNGVVRELLEDILGLDFVKILY